MKTCKIDGCENKYIAKGFCGKHYQKFRTYGDPLYRFVYPVKKCSIDGCDVKSRARGMCEKHYYSWKEYGDPLITKIEKHGMIHSPEYTVWRGMKRRCFNKNNDNYQRYGGRGITVCDEWKNSFIAFFGDMGKRPTPKHQIDRIDNDGNYEPGNCEWVTPAKNTQNRKSTKMNWFMVRSLRKLSEKKLFSQRELGLIYNISTAQAGNILNNKTWKVVK